MCSSGEEDLSTALQHVAEDSGKGPQQDADPQHQPEVSPSLWSLTVMGVGH